MFYLAGYILACFAAVGGLGFGLSLLHRKSTLRPPPRQAQEPPLIRSHALISFSIILPFSALAFLLLTFSAMKVAQGQVLTDHFQFIAGSMLLPTACFLIGYFYFKKVVGS